MYRVKYWFYKVVHLINPYLIAKDSSEIWENKEYTKITQFVNKNSD